MYRVTEGDTGQLVPTLLTEGGEPLGLQGASVALRVATLGPAPEVLLDDVAGQVVQHDGLDAVTYSLQVGDLPAGSAGRYMAQWLVTDSSGATKAYGAELNRWMTFLVSPLLPKVQA